MKNKGWIALEVFIILVSTLLFMAGIAAYMKAYQENKNNILPKVEQCLEKCEFKCSQLQ